MRYYAVLVLTLITVYHSSFAQPHYNNSRFAEIDDSVSEIRKQAIFHPQLIAEKLTEDLTNDYDKVRAFYVWIAKNIEYDLLASIHKRTDGQNIKEVFRSGKALCYGYSLLFKYFCELANIESEIIEGYAKDYAYKKGQAFESSNHAWNAVNIYGYWYLLDVTWAAGSPRSLANHKRKIELDTYFLVPPEKFAKAHLPEDPSWQLMENKVTLEEFEKNKYNDISDAGTSAFSPKDYEHRDEGDKDLLHYKRSLLFNPKNEQFKVLLSWSYIYKAISITENLWKMDYSLLTDTTRQLDANFYSYMDSASMLIETIDFWKVAFTKHKFYEEINYQKGVFNYQFGVDLFMKAINENIDLYIASSLPELYFETSKAHFQDVPLSSIYQNDTNDYLTNMRDFKRRWTAYYSLD